MKLQRMLSNGMWVDVKEGLQEKYIRWALEFDQSYPDTFRGKVGLQTTEDVLGSLDSGKSLRYDSDWYNSIRCDEAFSRLKVEAEAKRNVDPNYSEAGWKLDCGCTVNHRSHIMNASNGTSCTDCYDRMSDS